MSMTKPEFKKWPSINSFKSVHKHLSRRNEVSNLTYFSKVKLDGTNAGIDFDQYSDPRPQSRNRRLNVDDDNFGFAKWVKENIEPYKRRFVNNSIIFGEFYGKGISKNVACSQIEDKRFAIFSIFDKETGYYIVHPDSIRIYIPLSLLTYVDILPIHKIYPTFNIHNPVEVKGFLDEVNEDVLSVEKEDPFMLDMFGISGIGEGLVFYQTQNTNASLEDSMFKAKGEAHRVNKSKNAAETQDIFVNPTVLQFVEEVCTIPRYEQACVEVGITDFDRKQIGPFLKWVVNDIRKDASNGNVTYPEDVPESKVNSVINTQARQWFLTKENEL